MNANSWRRKAPLVIAILLLSVPAALGIIRYLEPTRGFIGSRSAAIGFEMLYLSIGVLIIPKSLRGYARSVAISAVLASVVFNTLADYSSRVPGGLENTEAFLNSFDTLSAILSFLESLPLAGLAYAATTLIHRLQEDSDGVEVQTIGLWQRLKDWAQGIRKEPTLDLNDVLREVFVAKQRNPAVHISTVVSRAVYNMLRQELLNRKNSGEAKTATISALWGVTGGAQYGVASRIYDEATT